MSKKIALRRCSSPKHEGERDLPEAAFYKDAMQPSGFRSHCIRCVRDQQQSYKDKNAEKSDARDEKLLDKARQEAADRQRRIESDYANLRPDDLDSEDEDYDTSVANDPGPAAKARSAAASRQKRQEYSEAMGKHLGAVRRAAVDEALGGDLIESMPGESGEYVGKLAEQERRFGNRRLARAISLYAAGEEQSRRLFMMAARQYLTGRVVPTGYAAKGPSSRKMKRSVVLLLSDLHLGSDLSAAENPMPFRAVEEARRLEYVMRQAIDYKPQYRSDSELVLLLNGDLIEGLLMHDFRDGAPLTEQKVVFLKYFERMLGEFARTFPRVRVFCQPGNHGRNLVRHPGRATSSKWDGIEVMLYYALSRACSGLKNVTWDIPFRAVGIVDLHGQNLLLTHADTEVKIGDPDTKAAQNRAVIDKINATRLYGVDFVAAAFGHYHKARYLPGHPRLVFNAALVPPNGHARTSGYIGETCGQFLWEAVEGHAVGDVRFIEVGLSQDCDERLGKVLVPFRFDLQAADGNLAGR